MIRNALTLLAAVLAVFQPALGFCACAGCGSGCGDYAAASNSAPSCCSATAIASPPAAACCGSHQGECPCGNCGSSSPSDSSDAPGDQPCLCSASAPPTFVTTPGIEIEHIATIAHWLATPTAPIAGERSSVGAAFSGDRGPPPRVGHLRVHAYLGVWIV